MCNLCGFMGVGLFVVYVCVQMMGVVYIYIYRLLIA